MSLENIVELCNEFKKNNFELDSKQILKFVPKEIFYEIIDSKLIRCKMGNKYIAALTTDEQNCVRFKKFRYKVVKNLGEGAYGVAYHVKLKEPINGNVDFVIKLGLVQTRSVVPCRLTGENILVCSNTNEILMHTRIINKLADIENKMFSFVFFQCMIMQFAESKY